jgi:hypothetical protein
MLTARTTPKPLAEPCTIFTGPAKAPYAGFELAVTLPVAVPLATEVSLKSVVPVMPHPDSGASGQVDTSEYCQRPVPSGWISSTPEWPPPQCPSKGASCAARSVVGADWLVGGAGLPAGVEGGLAPPHAPRSAIAATHPSSGRSRLVGVRPADQGSFRIAACPFPRSLIARPRRLPQGHNTQLSCPAPDRSQSDHFLSTKILGKTTI